MEDSPTPASSPEIPAQEPDRRKFVQKTACIALGGAATLGPVAAGVTVLLNPLFKESQAGLKVRITSLDALPTGGAPQLFKVSAVSSSNALAKVPHLQISLPSTPLARISAALWSFSRIPMSSPALVI